MSTYKYKRTKDIAGQLAGISQSRISQQNMKEATAYQGYHGADDREHDKPQQMTKDTEILS